MKKIIRRFYHAISGILHALKNDHSVQLHVLIAILVLPSAYFILSPVALWEVLLVLLGWFLILITEIQNSALEAALDKLHPERHNNIKQSKDMAAGAVLLSGVYFFLVLGILILSRTVN